MAKRTFLQFVQKVHRECALSGNPPSSVTNQVGLFAKLVDWVADSAYEIEASHGDWDFMWYGDWTVSVTQSSPEYSAPSDMGQWNLETVYLDYSTNDFQQLQEMDYRAWKTTQGPGVQQEGKPGYFIVQPDHSLRLYPVPDAAYTLSADYWTKPTLMAASSDTCNIPEEYERVVIALAKMKFAEDQGAQVLLINAQSEYSDWFTRLETGELTYQRTRRNLSAEPMVVQAV